MKKRITIKELMKEIDKREPTNIIDYIFRGSGLTQVLNDLAKEKKNKE